MKKISLMAVLFAVAVCFTAPQAGADDGFIGWDGLISGTTNPIPLSGVGVDYLAVHADQDINGSGFKGWAYIGAMNTGNANWTGMHISLYDATVGVTTFDAKSVKIIGYSPYAPSAMAPNSIASFVIGTNASGHATMDIMFSSAVAPNGAVFVQLWTDNTAQQVPYFGVAFHAIPEPATGSLVALTGVVALFIRKRYGLR